MAHKVPRNKTRETRGTNRQGKRDTRHKETRQGRHEAQRDKARETRGAKRQGKRDTRHKEIGYVSLFAKETDEGGADKL